MSELPEVPEEFKHAPKILRILNVRMSIQMIYFVKTRRVVATAGLEKNYGKWMAAIVHFETHKIIVNTKPVFESKKQALEFCEELIHSARNAKIS